ncbi:MAG TPA: GGDEF domain-containing protein [Candidatus Saccharimonadia bacterium]|nr:GGDEF domain-containing protein [Candidatus Saccharimonadia bacterium]
MVSDGREAGARSRAQFRLAQEISDTHRRTLVGGVFYLVGWLIVGGYGGAFERHRALATLLAAAFMLLAIARHVVLPPSDPRSGRLWLVWNWSVLIATALCWGAASLWSRLDPAFGAAQGAALLCNVALATAVAHNFAMRPALALAAMGFIFMPALAALWITGEERAVAVVLSVYVFYLLLALVRSHREYESRLELDWQLREQRDSFERLSRLDPLTGIANRRSFQDALARAAERVQANGEPLSLLMLDLDHFKYVNDRHGHVVGDHCLVAFTRELASAFGDAFVARLGGEEFAVLLPVRGRVARELAEGFRASLASRPLQLGEREVAMTVSIGVGEYHPIRGHLPEALVRHVDRALYRAKDEGRDRVCDTAGEAISL